MTREDVTHVEKVCAYVTRNGSELLVFRGPERDGLQVPGGTVEPGESPREAMYRETVEESGLVTFGEPQHLVTDVWQRRESPPKRYVRNFFQVPVYEAPDAWTHTVTGSGQERGAEFEFTWVDLETNVRLALDLDDYLHVLADATAEDAATDVAAD